MTDDRVRSYYDDFASSYERGRDRGYHRMVDEIEASIVLPYAANQRVLEVGCGTGLVLSRVAPVAKSATGVDLSPRMLDAARARGLDVREGSATDLPFPNESFDVVCSFKVLAHVPDLRRALSEVSRVLAPGGTAIIEVYNRHSLRYLARFIAGARAIGRVHREDDITTRWDTLESVRGDFPDALVPIEHRGVRIVTPFAGVHRVPLMRDLFVFAERRLVHSPLAKFGGFLVVVAKKAPAPR
jgi:SAM-dependent methyltransferase